MTEVLVAVSLLSGPGAYAAPSPDPVAPLLERFRRHDPTARREADRWLRRKDSNLFDARNDFIRRLGGLNDPESLALLRATLMGDRIYDAQFAALGLGQRREPAAEDALVERMLATGGDGYVGGICRVQLVARPTRGAARGILRWAAMRRDMRDDATAVLRGWLAGPVPTMAPVVAGLAEDPDPAVAALARGFFACHPLTNTACGLPGAPAEGEAPDGSADLTIVKAWRQFVWQGIARNGPPPQNVFVRVRANVPLYPYAVALAAREAGRSIRQDPPAAPVVVRVYRLARAPMWDAAPRAPRVAWLDRGETALISNTFYQTYYFSAELPGWRLNPPLADGEGELVFFAGEAKRSVRFTVEPAKVPPGGPPPVP